MTQYALVVGISQYNYFDSLPNTTTDAEAVAQVLEKHGNFQNVKRLPEGWNDHKKCYEVAPWNVSKAELDRALKTFLLEQAVKSDALIYFTGHGISVFENSLEPNGYLVTSECVVEQQNGQAIEQKYAYPLTGLNKLIQKSDLSSLVLILDCCHSGSFLERELVEQSLTVFSPRKNYYLITACRSYEEAYFGEQHSVFTEAMLEGLERENANNYGEISGDLLFDYISRKLKGSGQEPIRMGWGNSINLVTYSSSEKISVDLTFNQDNPYQGLNAFESEQEKYFFGREEAVRTLISHLTNSRFLPIIGYSGSGKSSLVKAGLLPELRRDRLPGSSEWDIEIFTPGKNPLGKLIDILSRSHKSQVSVLFIDQFEEIFTLCEDEAERKSFIRLVADEMNSSESKNRIIITIRGDFLIKCADYPEVGNLINRVPPTTYIVMPLSFQDLIEAIEKPAALHGVKFEDGLVSQIANDVVNQPGALPLLQFALKELWQVCIEELNSPMPLLTKRGYEEVGGVRGALENRANLVYRSFSEEDKIFARQLFIELVNLDIEDKITKRPVSWERLEAIANSQNQRERVIRILAGPHQRLIVTSKETLEVAHEALLSNWQLLKDWIEENRENIRISRRFERVCYEWKEIFKKSDEALMTGLRLAEVEEWQEKTQHKLTADEAEFFQRSVAKREQEKQAELEQEKRLRELAEAKVIAETEKALEAEARVEAEKDKVEEAETRVKIQKQRTGFAITAGVLVALTMALGLFAKQLSDARKQREVIAASALIGKAETLLETHNQLEALIASVEALAELKKIGIQEQKILKRINTVISNVKERNRLKHPDVINSVSFSPDGTIIATAGGDTNIMLWNFTGKVESSIVRVHQDNIWRVRFSPNGKLLASTSSDNTVKIWTINGKMLQTLEGHKGPVYDVTFSNDNQQVASASADGSVRIWDVNNGKLIKELIPEYTEKKGNKKIYGLDFSPKNKSILITTGISNYDLIAWDVSNTNQYKYKYIGKTEGTVMSVRFNQEGTMIISCNHKGIIEIWDEFGNIIGRIKDGDDIDTMYADFSDDNKFIASTTVNGTIKIWSLRKALEMWKENLILEKPIELNGHKGVVNHLDFHPNNSAIIASASEDRTVRIWDITESQLKTAPNLDLDNLLVKSCFYLKTYLGKKVTSSLRESGNICSDI